MLKNKFKNCGFRLNKQLTVSELVDRAIAYFKSSTDLTKLPPDLSGGEIYEQKLALAKLDKFGLKPFSCSIFNPLAKASGNSKPCDLQ